MDALSGSGAAAAPLNYQIDDRVLGTWPVVVLQPYMQLVLIIAVLANSTSCGAT
jgi:hypothetical protein